MRSIAIAWSLVLLVVGCDDAPSGGTSKPTSSSLFSTTAAPSSTARANPDPEPSALRFDDVTSEWKVALRHHAGRHDDKWLPETVGGGIALADLDRDGAVDILLVDSGDLITGPVEGVGPRLLLGDGKGGFRDVTEAWELTPAGYGMGVAVGDVDGDGWPDVYLTTFDARDRLLRNDEGKRFVDVTSAWGIEPAGWSTSAAFLDGDHDGDLDLYVTRYVNYSLKSAIKCWFRTIHIYCTPGMYEALPDRLLKNEGTAFVDVSESSGVAAHAAKGLAVGTGDLDDDGDTDLYVANDISQNFLLTNDGKGHFEDVAIPLGVAYSELGREEASMGVSVSDSNADGRWDIAVTNFQGEPTSLYTRREQGSYRERSAAAGIGASSRARLSFGVEWLDADNDGDEDLLVANGHISDNVASYRENVTFAQPNSLYRRVGDGAFVDVSEGAGTALAASGVSRGLAVGDIDGDGGLDYVVVNNDGQLQVARNATTGRGHWLSLWLEGRAANRSAIGALVVAKVGGRELRREVRGASSYLSVSDRRVHLGLGEATQIDELTVRWPGGAEQKLGPQPVDVHLHLVQGQAPDRYVPGERVVPP